MNCKLVQHLELVKAISGTKMDSSRCWGCLVLAFLGRKVLTMKKERTINKSTNEEDRRCRDKNNISKIYIYIYKAV